MPPTAADKFIRFFSHDIWRLREDKLSKPEALLLKAVRIMILTIKGYMQDNCTLRASALTFYSLLSVVPVVAMAFGIAKGFGLEQRLQKQLFLRFAGQEEVISKIIDFARSLLENTKGGLIAGIGVALLFWSAIKVLGHIESALNHIWKVKARSFIRKFADYLSIMTVSPLLVIVASSVNVFVTTQVKTIAGKLALLHAASPLIYAGLKLLPFGLLWLLFVMIYMVMPNTRVRFSAALTAGLIAGTTLQVFQGLYINAQVVVSQYNAIYGSFAALPLFLIWLQLSWMIVLLGAEIAYAHQHINDGAMAAGYHDTSPDFRQRFALHVLRLIIVRFEQGSPPLTAAQMAQTLKAPFLLVAPLLDRLRQGGLVSAVEPPETNGPPAYQPARDIQTITIASVLEALDRQGEKEPAVEENADWVSITQAVAHIREEISRCPANKRLKDL